MPQLTFLKPVDQPTGKLRLLEEIKTALRSGDYNRLRIAVGFAKVGPLLRLAEDIEAWNSARGDIEAIFGIDHMGTSKEALEYSLRQFAGVYVTNVSSSRQSTFHPKLYIFYSDNAAVCYYGSHNLTVGGTETNFEGGVKILFDRRVRDDEEAFQQLLGCWTSLLPGNCAATSKLDLKALEELVAEGVLLEESKSVRGARGSASRRRRPSGAFKVKPPSGIPKGVISRSQTTRRRGRRRGGRRGMDMLSIPAKSLVIQIVPHHNGEIFLSKIAVDQCPEFFGYPFSGKTTPKKKSNKAYPQRKPDPVVDITVFDAAGRPIPSLDRVGFPLNMVYYKAKSEIRITMNPDHARGIPHYSVLVMTRSETDSDSDYEMEIYSPGSERFREFMEVCTQTLPSGGSKRPRKMGWL